MACGNRLQIWITWKESVWKLADQYVAVNILHQHV